MEEEVDLLKSGLKEETEALVIFFFLSQSSTLFYITPNLSYEAPQLGFRETNEDGSYMNVLYTYLNFLWKSGFEF